MNHTNQPKVETEVGNALTAYKLALIHAHYRNTWHRLACWVGDKSALHAESNLKDAEEAARKVVNLSAEHKSYTRLISSRQPDFVRAKDKFLDLIQND